MNDSFKPLREAMVKNQIERRGVRDANVLTAFRTVPRHKFVPDALIANAYDDSPLPIGLAQTISQPYIVALMTAAAEIKPHDRLLEIGTGSGYQAAICSQLAEKVFTVERLRELGDEASQRFKDLGYRNIEVLVGDGSVGWQAKAPFDVILVTAGAPVVPASLIAQLAEGGRLILPVGEYQAQQLLRIRKEKSGMTQEILESVRFVPLIGQEGWEKP